MSGKEKLVPCTSLQHLPYRVLRREMEYDDYNVCFDPVDYLYVPAMIDGNGSCGCIVEVQLPLAKLIVYWSCGTSGCSRSAYLVPVVDVLKPIVKRALRKLWEEYVEEVEVWYWDGESYAVRKWRVNPETLDTISNTCYQDDIICRREETIVARLPLRRLRELLEEYGGNAVTIIEEAKRQIEELEKRIRESRESGELELEAAEQLSKKARWLKEMLYLNVSDELEFE